VAQLNGDDTVRQGLTAALTKNKINDERRRVMRDLPDWIVVEIVITSVGEE